MTIESGPSATPPPAATPPKKTNPWLIVVVVIVVVCCCCLGAIGLIWSFWEPIRDTLNEMGIYVFTPTLVALI